MKTSFAIIISLLVMVYPLNGQTLITLGTHTVSKQEFLNAFHKNSNADKPSEKAMRDYLQLYINYKLKVKAAYDEKLHQQPNQVAELNDFKNQVIETYLNDQSTLEQLINEAAERSKKDIRVAHIYIPIDSEKKDSAKAWKTAQDAYKELQRGTDFGNVALLYSADTSVRSNKGDIGYITAFTLPYAFESEIYKISPGKVTRPFRSAAGYHIFKNLGERKALGTIRTAQILLAFPPDADHAGKHQMRLLADSIYQALVNGAAFNDMVAKFSTDRITLSAHGDMQEYGIGTYEPAFENAVFALTTVGEITKPLVTSHGYHIVKLIDRKPLMVDSGGTAFLESVKAKVEKDQRINISKDALTKKVLHKTGIKSAPVNQQLLFIYADSILQHKKVPVLPGITNKTVLFTMPKQKIFVSDWGKYLHDIREMPFLSAGKTPRQLLQQYKETAAIEYYRNHLEDYNQDFAIQVRDFKEGNMLFEIMQKNIWDKASADSAGLLAYYNANPGKYMWQASADLIMVNFNDLSIINEFKDKFLRNKSEWRTIAAAYEGRLQADSGRYELSQLPGGIPTTFKTGELISTDTNQTDNTATIMYIIRTYSQNSPRKFEDAKGIVLNDYQQMLEEKWIEDLKKKYPVYVNEAVLKTLWK